MKPVYFVTGQMMPVDVLEDAQEARALFGTMLAVEFPALYSWDGVTLRRYESGMGYYVVEGFALRSQVPIKILEACRERMPKKPAKASPVPMVLRKRAR